jgi:mRNA-decapping enzyme subunit 2
LPRFKHLKPFAVEMFQFSPLLDISQFQRMWETFSKYKRKISTFGTILLNQDCTKVVLCQEWNSKAWMFPAGKINQGEDGIDAAARETWEETGFDPNGKYGLTQQMEAAWQKPLLEKDAVSYTEEGGKHRTFFICHGVPEDFPFSPVARKEVAAVAWHSLEKVPKKNFAVLPVLPKVRRWIKRNTQQKTPKRARDRSNPAHDRTSSTPRNQKDNTNTTPLKSNKTPNRKDNNRKTPQQR